MSKPVVTVDDLAQEIRRVDGNHSLGAGALAEALMPFIEAALTPAFERQEPVATEIALSIDTLRDEAWNYVRRLGWTATARLSLHQVTELMAAFGKQSSDGMFGCGYPECGCCHDAACEDAIKQHPDFASPVNETERMREALERLVKTYAKMEDGDGNPCPDVQFALSALGRKP